MRCAPCGEKGVGDEFGLLLDAIGGEMPHRIEAVRIAAERVAHQQQIEAAALLALPYMHEFVDEERLQGERRGAEIVAVVGACRMKMNMAHWRHDRAARLEREEAAAADAHRREIDRGAKHAVRERPFTGRERPLTARRSGKSRAHIWSIMPSMAPVSCTLAKVLTLSPLASVKVTSTSVPAFIVLARLNSMT